jgi:plasmid stabilization system protein ParE
MAVEVNWSPEAVETFSQNFDYLRHEWGEKEAEKFLLQTNQVITRLQLFPESYPKGVKSKNIAKPDSINTLCCFMLIIGPRER